MTLEELQEIEAKAAQLRGVVFHLGVPVSAELEEFAIQTRPNILKLCAALREAWARITTLTTERNEAQFGESKLRVQNERLQARVLKLEVVVQAAKKLYAEDKVLGELGDAPTDYHDMQNELCADLYRRLMSAVDALESAECAAKREVKPLELARQTLAVFQAVYPPDVPMLCSPDSPDSGPRLTFAVQKALHDFITAWEEAQS